MYYFGSEVVVLVIWRMVLLARPARIAPKQFVDNLFLLALWVMHYLYWLIDFVQLKD